MLDLELLNTGLLITLIGMGVVFSFLIILVFAMTIMSSVVRKLNEIFPEQVASLAPAAAKKSSSNDEEIAIAIAATRVLS